MRKSPWRDRLHFQVITRAEIPQALLSTFLSSRIFSLSASQRLRWHFCHWWISPRFFYLKKMYLLNFSLKKLVWIYSSVSEPIWVLGVVKIQVNFKHFQKNTNFNPEVDEYYFWGALDACLGRTFSPRSSVWEPLVTEPSNWINGSSEYQIFFCQEFKL